MTDISFYKYLEAAFRHKLFKDTKAASFNFLGFNLPYESMAGKKGIFEYSRRVLPSFYSLHFPDTEEGHLQMAKDFLQKLDRHQDPELPKYFDPNQAPVEYEPVIKEAKIESAAPAAMPESPLPPPPAPKAPPARRIIILPSSQEEEEGEKPTPAQPVATPPQETGAPPPSTAGMPQTPSMSFSTSVGQPLPERKDKEKKKRWFGKLRSGKSLFDFLPMRQAANWIWRNMLRPVLNFTWRSILQPALRWLAGQAGRLLFSWLPRLAMGALNALLGLLGGIGGWSGIAFAVGSAALWGVVAVVSFVAVTILATFLSPFITPIKEPVQVDFTLPLRNPNVVPHDIKALIKEGWDGAQIDNWQKIIEAAKANNWNPALLLTLWIEASGAQGKTGYLDPLGCDPDSKHPKDNLDQSLQCFFGKFKDYKDNEFPDFIKAYAESNTAMTGDYQGYESYYNEDFLQRIKYWYAQMVLEGELGTITPINRLSLDYKIPFRDSTVSVDTNRIDTVTDLIKISWPNAKLANWNIIVSQSIAANWNPAFVLALWIEESGAQGTANYSDALGCAPQQPTDDINISLKCLFDNFNQYQDSQFQQFMETYSGGPAGNPFGNNPNFPFNIKSWYATLIPAGSHGAIEPVTPPVGALASCPVPEGKIKTPSYQASPTTGHCSLSYGSCPAGSRRAKSIDVDTKGGNVLFPTIDGQEVNWYLINQFPLVSNDCEGGISDCGIMTVFQAPVGSTKWVLHLLHLDPNPNIISFHTSGPNRSGSIAGKTVSGVYVHINIGKGILNAQYPPPGDLDLDQGWLAPDFMCQ